MARQEREVDPNEGPLQSLAYDLRKLRVEAGNPTYRVMAKAAGYSASTLSQAAAGLRKPSLDVLLAYVGACDGDKDEWRRRWLELDAESPVEVESPDEVPPAPEDRAPQARRRAFRVAGGGFAAVVVAAMVWTALPQDSETPTSISGCPPLPSAPVFTGTTYGGGVYVRSAPRRDQSILRTIPAGCTVGFVGFCLGDKIEDATAETGDVRWFRLEDGGVLASALVHGNPPATLTPGRCPGDRPVPSSVDLTVTGGADSMELKADGKHADIIGFAAYYAADPHLPDERRWHQISFDDSDAPTFGTPWRPDRLRNPPDRTDELPVAAAACLGGEGPTNAVDIKLVRTDGSSRGAPSFDTEQRAAAARSACLYP